MDALVDWRAAFRCVVEDLYRFNRHVIAEFNDDLRDIARPCQGFPFQKEFDIENISYSVDLRSRCPQLSVRVHGWTRSAALEAFICAVRSHMPMIGFTFSDGHEQSAFHSYYRAWYFQMLLIHSSK
jgi:hypothetical protein